MCSKDWYLMCSLEFCSKYVLKALTLNLASSMQIDEYSRLRYEFCTNAHWKSTEPSEPLSFADIQSCDSLWLQCDWNGKWIAFKNNLQIWLKHLNYREKPPGVHNEQKQMANSACNFKLCARDMRLGNRISRNVSTLTINLPCHIVNSAC